MEGCTIPAVPPMPRVRCGWRGSTPPIGIRQFSCSCTCSGELQLYQTHPEPLQVTLQAERRCNLKAQIPVEQALVGPYTVVQDGV